jgi:mannan endo-1,4-beta-mannosidase
MSNPQLSTSLRKMKSKLFWRPTAFLLLIAILISLSFNTPGVTRVNAAPGFVSRSGSHFTLNGSTWYVAGTNNHYLGWGSQVEVDNVLNDAKAMKFNVVRTIMHSIRGSLDGTTRPTLWNWASTGNTSNMGMHGVYIMYWDPATSKMAYNDSTTTGLGRWDYVIWKAGQLGIKLNISFLDFWQWAGGIQQINANLKNDPNYNMSSASDRYTYFFSNAVAKQTYKDWVNHVLNRVNTLTGVAYKNDPTIMAWDLMNEPEMSSAVGQTWITEMAAYVKTIDTNHLLATGNEGFTDGHAGSSVSLEVNNQPNIDFATWHTYPAYHGISTAQVSTLIEQHCDIAAAGGKPVLLQEFAYSFNNSNQATVYQSWVDKLFDKDCAGWLFWRLTSIEDTGSYSPDNGEGFDVHNDNSATANVFINAAIRSLARNAPQATNTPCVGCTNTPTKTKTPTNTPTKTNTPTPVPFGTFVKGVNINGNAVTIEGNAWLAYSTALSQGLSQTGGLPDTKSLTPNPATDAATSAMLNSLLYSSSDPGTISLAQTISNGTYQVYIWEMENDQANSRSINLKLEGVQLASGLAVLPLNGWAKYGPYQTAVSDGVLNIDLVATQGRAMIMGFAIFTNGAGPTSTPIPPTATKTNTPVPTFAPPTNTPSGPTATKTNTPLPPTNTPIPPTSSGTNIAPSGTGYTWYNISTTYAGNQRNEVGINNGNLTADFALTGSGDDNTGADEAAGVIWSATQTIRTVKYYNGTCDQYDNAPFTANLRIQFSTNGTTWTTDSAWTVSPAYPYDSCTAGGQIYTFSGPVKTGVKGVRVIGTVHSTGSSLSWHAKAKEVQVFN